MNSFAWNLLGARAAPFALAALIGLELAHISWQLLPELAVPLSALALVAPKDRAVVPDHAISVASVLESMRRFDPWEAPLVVPDKPAAPVVKEVVVDSNLDLNLIGAMILPQFSWAILTRKKDPNTQIVLQVGEEVDGATLKRIERNIVYFDNHGRIERIVMLDALKQDKSATEPQPSSGVTLLQSLSREEYAAMLSKGMGLLAGVNITPFYQGKDSVGYQVKFPDSNMEFKKVGLTSEDVIQQVNGISVTDTAQIQQLANQLQGQSALRIDLLRNNQSHVIELNIGQ